jgi:hypothetical protein
MAIIPKKSINLPEPHRKRASLSVLCFQSATRSSSAKLNSAFSLWATGVSVIQALDAATHVSLGLVSGSLALEFLYTD